MSGRVESGGSCWSKWFCCCGGNDDEPNERTPINQQPRDGNATGTRRETDPSPTKSVATPGNTPTRGQQVRSDTADSYDW